MARHQYRAQEIISERIREAEGTLAEGATVAEAVRRSGITEPSERTPREVGRLLVDQTRRLKQLERENARLKELGAGQAVYNAVIWEIAQGNF